MSGCKKASRGKDSGALLGRGYAVGGIWGRGLWGASAVTPVPYKKIGLIGTEATVRSHYYQKRFPITSAVACPKLVASIEQGDLDLSELEYLSKDIEALLLGCTHFPLIQEHLPPIPLIDPSRALAESLPKTTGSSTFYTTGDPLQFHQRATIFSKRKKIPFPFPLKSLYSSSLS